MDEATQQERYERQLAKAIVRAEKAETSVAELEATRTYWIGEVKRLTQNSCDDQSRIEEFEKSAEAAYSLILLYLARAERAEARVAELEAKLNVQ
jgi:hypothetical protein